LIGRTTLALASQDSNASNYLSFAAEPEETVGIQLSLFSSIDGRGYRLNAGKLTMNTDNTEH
jgi:hypothetical protein